MTELHIADIESEIASRRNLMPWMDQFRALVEAMLDVPFAVDDRRTSDSADITFVSPEGETLALVKHAIDRPNPMDTGYLFSIKMPPPIVLFSTANWLGVYRPFYVNTGSPHLDVLQNALVEVFGPTAQLRVEAPAPPRPAAASDDWEDLD